MKKYLIHLLCVLFISTAFAQKSTKKEKEEALANKVTLSVESQKYEVRVNSALPTKGQFVSLSSSYSVRISEDSIYSYLPFYGEAYVAPFGNDNGLIFDSTIQDYKVKKKKELYEISFFTKANNDRLKYNITISVGGYATVHVISNNRSSISYNGELILPLE